MRTIFLLIAFLLLSVIGFTQIHKRDRWSVSANFEGVFSAGKFGNKTSLDSNAAYAKSGIGATLNVEYAIKPNIHILLNISGQQHNVDSKKLGENHSNSFNDTLLYAFNIGKWKIGKLLAGISYEYPLDKKNRNFLIAKVCGGVFVTSSPKAQYASVNLNQGSIFEATHTDKKLYYGIAASAGLGYKTFLSKKIFLQFNANYNYACVKLPVTNFYLLRRSNISYFTVNLTSASLSLTPNTDIKIPKYPQPLGSVNLSGGIGIVF